MKELKLLFTEAWKETKNNPLEFIGSLIALLSTIFILYGLTWVLWALEILQSIDMSYEDLMWDIYTEISELKLRSKFDKQVKKMHQMEKYKYKTTREIWESAARKVIEKYKNGKN